jgi:hypothetical protein
MKQDTSKRQKELAPAPHPPCKLRHLISVAKEKGQMEVPRRGAGPGPSAQLQKGDLPHVGSGKGSITQSLPHFMMEDSGTNGNASKPPTANTGQLNFLCVPNFLVCVWQSLIAFLEKKSSLQ